MGLATLPLAVFVNVNSVRRPWRRRGPAAANYLLQSAMIGEFSECFYDNLTFLFFFSWIAIVGMVCACVLKEGVLAPSHGDDLHDFSSY